MYRFIQLPLVMRTCIRNPHRCERRRAVPSLLPALALAQLHYLRGGNGSLRTGPKEPNKGASMGRAVFMYYICIYIYIYIYGAARAAPAAAKYKC